MGEIVNGVIEEVRDDCLIIRTTSPPDKEKLIHRRYEDCRIQLLDSRRISTDQRKKASALIDEIAYWGGSDKTYTRAALKYDFLKKHLETLSQEFFSLSDVDMTSAKEFITYLVDFCLQHGVPTKVPLWDSNDDVQAYVYSCLMHKKCAICQRKAELHHVDRVGMGNDRTAIQHIGRLCMPLCRIHHRQVDDIGDAALFKMYHLEPVKIDEQIFKKYKLKGDNKK